MTRELTEMEIMELRHKVKIYERHYERISRWVLAAVIVGFAIGLIFSRTFFLARMMI